ncbi:MAG TPA: lysylphosphatidylglycerol synthase transmembrane domain-containing protein [Thermomicrobiaceae bacterium]|nr:lysylphosphatidylglycerol synthase transmembrane domain-containing protein [Thermomicrobiaceae bacterium]
MPQAPVPTPDHARQRTRDAASGAEAAARSPALRLGVAVLSLLCIVLLLAQRGDITDMLATLRGGRPGWLALALLLEAGWFVNQMALYQSLYRLLRLPASLRQLAPLVLASNFVNFATPSASLGAVPLFLEDAGQRGLDTSRVVLINLLRLWLNLVWFSIPLIFSLAVLAGDGRLRLYHLAAAALLLGATSLVSLGLVLAGRHPRYVGELLGGGAARLDRLAGRVRRRGLIEADRARQFGTRLGQAAQVIRLGGRRLLRPWGHAVATDALQLLVLATTLRAFPGAGAIGAVPLVVIFSISVLFSVVAVTPQGVGSSEAATIAVLMSFGVPMMRAVPVVLAYRGVTFWLPFLAGFAALHALPGRHARAAASRRALGLGEVEE